MKFLKKKNNIMAENLITCLSVDSNIRTNSFLIKRGI